MSIQDSNMQQTPLTVGKGIKTDFLFNMFRNLSLSPIIIWQSNSSQIFIHPDYYVLCSVGFISPLLMQGKLYS